MEVSATLVFIDRLIGTMLLWGLISVPIAWAYLAWKMKAKNWRDILNIVRGRPELDNPDNLGNSALTFSVMVVVLVGLFIYSIFADSQSIYFEGLSIEIIGSFIGFFFVIVLEDIIRGDSRSIETNPQLDTEKVEIPSVNAEAMEISTQFEILNHLDAPIPFDD